MSLDKTTSVPSHQFQVVQTFHVVLSLLLAHTQGDGAVLTQASHEVLPQCVAAPAATLSTVTRHHPYLEEADQGLISCITRLPTFVS